LKLHNIFDVLYHFYDDALYVSKSVIMNMSSLIFSWLISVGFVVPLNETNEGRELYVLYVIDHETENVLAYEQAYKEEIMEWVQTGDFEYDKDLKMLELRKMEAEMVGVLGEIKSEVTAKGKSFN
jgi:hypothetical protein